MARIARKSNRSKNIFGTASKPRLAVKKTLGNIIAQVIDDEKAHTLAYAVTAKDDKCNIESAKKVGVAIAEKAKAAGVSEVVFDKRNYRFHGKIKALADAAREAGLNF